MGRSANDSPSVLGIVLAQWPLLIFVPTVLVLVAVLAGVTRWWDGRDEAHVTEKDEARITATTKIRDAWRRPWRRQPPCTCSWHTIGTEIGAGGG